MGRDPAERSVELADGRRLSLRDWPGTEPTVVLLHGLLDSARGWDSLVRALAEPVPGGRPAGLRQAAVLRALPQATYVVWTGTGHHPQSERPCELLALIADAGRPDAGSITRAA